MAFIDELTPREVSMAQRKTLTERQIALLRWIAGGCPAGLMPNEFHRISAAALRRRGLVTTSGHGDAWTAGITRAGEHYLEQVNGKDPPIPRQPSVSVTQQLVDDVVAAGGSLRVQRKSPYDRDGVDYKNRAELAERYRKVPSGKRLTVAVVSREELEIALVDAPHRAAPAELTPVRVQQHVRRYHPVAREFLQQRDRHEVSRDLLPRATRIVHAIATEAERRGWSPHVPECSRNGYGRLDWTGTKDGHLRIDAHERRFWLRLQEDGVHTRGIWEEEVARYRNVDPNSSWYRDRVLPRGPYDADARGSLKLELHESGRWRGEGRQARWADRVSWMLEQRLPHLFREIQERIAEAAFKVEQERLAKEAAEKEALRAAKERARQWEVLMANAREHLVQEHCATELRRQASAWKDVQALSRYCDAVDAAYGNDPRTAEWLLWARAYIGELDPLASPPSVPEAPEPTPEALQRFLPEGWSAVGPEDPKHHRTVFELEL